MARLLVPRTKPTNSKINQSDLFADSYLVEFSDTFKAYLDPRNRKRLLSGIRAEPKYGAMTIQDAVAFVVAVAAALRWRNSNIRKANYLRARQLSKFAKSPPWYMPPDVASAQRMHRTREANRIIALAALGFAKRVGYATHSRVAWSCVERALLTEALVEFRKASSDQERISYFFGVVRARLNYQYRKLGKATVHTQADLIFSALSKRLRTTALSGASLHVLLFATPIEV